MIEINPGDHSHICVNNVHGIETSAETNLQYRLLDVTLLEDPERCEGGEFEVRQGNLASCRVNCLERLDDFRITGVTA